MTSSYTTNYNLEKPEDGNTNWGEAIRDGLDTIDAQLKINENTAINHIADTTDAHDASAISNTPSGALSATDVQTALDELQTDIETRATNAALLAHTGNYNNPHVTAAFQVPFNATGNLVADDVQEALVELQTELDTVTAKVPSYDDHIISTSNPHSVTATQVGKDTAQWNADRIKGTEVDATNIGDKKTLSYDLATNKLVYVAADGGGVTVYANLAAFPATEVDGTLALALDTYIVYVYKSIGGWTVESTPGSEINSINADTSEAQIITTDATGVDFGISTAAGTHTIHLPIASALNVGKLASADWSHFNDGANLADAATALNTPSTIVKRDASGNFVATKISLDQVQLNIAAAFPAHSEGLIGWDADEHTPFYYNDETDVRMNVRGDGPRVYNNTGSDITEGQCVRIGPTGPANRPTVVLANASPSIDEETADAGYAVATHTILGAGNRFGYVTNTGGTVNGVNTIALAAFVGETWVQGEVLYVNPLFPGYYTNVRPQEPNHRIKMCQVVEHAVNGKLYVDTTHNNGLDKKTKYNGLEDKSLFGLSYRADLGRLTVTYAAGAAVWVLGKRYAKSGSETLDHAVTGAGDDGKHYFYYNSSGVLVDGTSPWDLLTTAPLAQVYYRYNANSALSKGLLVNERHPGGDAGFDDEDHRYKHLHFGTQIKGTPTIAGFSIDTNTDVALQYTVASVDIEDEDLIQTVTAQTLAGPYPILYTDAVGKWTWDFTSTTGVLKTGGELAYNNATTGALAAVTLTNWGIYWPFALQTLGYSLGSAFTAYTGFWTVMGQSDYATLAAAQDASPLTLSYLANIADEGVVFAKMIYQRVAGGDKVELEEAPTYYRGNIINLGAAAFSPTNHSTLTNRTDANSHPASAISNIPAGNLIATNQQSVNDELQADIDLRAPIASPTFTGTVSGVTATMVGLGNVTNDAQIKASIIDTKGDIVTGTAADTPAILPVGTFGKSLTADSLASTGLSYKPMAPTANLIQYFDAEANATTGWTEATVTTGGSGVITSSLFPYADSTLVDGANSVWGIESGTPLNGTYSYKFTKQGLGKAVYHSFTLPAKLQGGKVVTMAGDAQVIGTLGTEGDLGFAIYDVDNSKWIQPTPYKLTMASGTQPLQAMEWQSPATGVNFKFVIFQAVASPAWTTVTFDDLFCGQRAKVFGAPVTDPVAATYTLSNMGNATVSGSVYRDGAFAIFEGLVTIGSSLPTGAVTVNLPAGYTPVVSNGFADSSVKASNGTNTYLGSAYVTGTSLIFAGHNAATWSATVPFTWANTNYFRFTVRLQITGWSSSTQMSEGASTRPISLMAHRTAATSALAGGVDTVVTFPTVLKDSVAGFNAGFDTYTVAIPGDYIVSPNLLFSAGASTTQVQVRIYKSTGGGAAALYMINDTQKIASGELRGLGKQVILPNLLAGDTIKIYAQADAGSATTVYSDTNKQTSISITLIQGPQQIAASERVSFKAYKNGNQTVNGDTKVTTWTTVKDSHGRFASDTYTIGTPGDYKIGMQIQTNVDAGSIPFAKVTTGGSTVNHYLGYFTTTLGTRNGGSILMPDLKVGDTIEFYTYTATSVTLYGGNGATYISVERDL